MNKPHKHAELIKAWVNGAEIQVNDIYGWVDCPMPRWATSIEYRIKPEPKPESIRTTMRLELDLIIETDGALHRVVSAKVSK